MSRMEERKRFLQHKIAPPQVSPGGVVLGQAPTQQQMQQMAQAKIDMHCVGVAQGIYNQVVAHILSTQDKHEQLTHEKMCHLAEQCKAAAPYVLQSFGALQITEQLLPGENLDAQAPIEEAESGNS